MAPANPSVASALDVNDVRVLRLAYSIESLAVEFGNTAGPILTAANAPVDLIRMMNESTQRHTVHQSTVFSLLQSRNSTAADEGPACKLRTELLSSTDEIARLNQELMYTAVGAYTGSTLLIANADLLAQMSRIMTVDARIAAEANRSAGLPAVPGPLDVVLTPAEVLARTQTVADCTAIDLPVPLETIVPGGVASMTTGDAATALAVNDLRVLQLSLLLETLALDLDNNAISLTNFSADAIQLFNSSVGIHSQHRALILAAIQERNSTAVLNNCTVTMSQTQASNASEALRRQQEMLYTIVGAYNGASIAISNLTLLLTSARVAAIDARLAAESNRTQGLSPFPVPLDVSLTPSEVLSRLQLGGATCPDLVLPQPVSAVLSQVSGTPTATATSTQTQTQTQTQSQSQSQTPSQTQSHTQTQSQSQSQQPRTTNPSLTLPSAASELAVSLVLLFCGALLLV